MKKSLLLLPLVVTFFALWAVSASAAFDDTVRVGLRYGSASVMQGAAEVIAYGTAVKFKG